MFLQWQKLDLPLGIRELSTYLDNWEVKPPLELEIGFGNGEFLCNLAKEKPDTFFIGVERSLSFCKKTERRAERLGLSNVMVLNADASFALSYIFPPRIFRDVYINFPDPWPKRRHRKKRLITTHFLKLLATRMVKGAYLTIVTDHLSYRDYILSDIIQAKCFKSAFSLPFLHELEGYFPTKYEKKWRRLGKRIYYMKFLKIRHPRIREKSLPLKVDIEGVTLYKRLKKEVLLSSFSPVIQREEENIYKLESLRNCGDTLSISAISKEGDLYQKFRIGVKIEDKETKIYLIDEDKLYPSYGVRIILDMVREVIEKG